MIKKSFCAIRIIRNTGLLAGISLIMLLTSCSKQKDKDHMNFAELKQEALTNIKTRKFEQATEHLEQIVAKHPDHKDIGKFKLILADSYFKTERYQSAFQLYEHFNQYYPADTKAEYAKYRAVLCQFYQTLRADCDQTTTEKTIELCKEYSENAHYTKYKKDIKALRKTCEKKLIDKEIYVYNFYLKQKKHDAAQHRLNYIKEHFLAQNKNLEPRVLYLECKLAQKKKDEKIAKDNLEKLFAKYPQSQYARMAQSLFTQDKFIF